MEFALFFLIAHSAYNSHRSVQVLKELGSSILPLKNLPLATRLKHNYITTQLVLNLRSEDGTLFVPPGRSISAAQDSLIVRIL